MGFSIPEHVVFQELDGEMVLLDLERSRYFGLDEVGARAWQLMAGQADLEVVVATLLDEYDVEEATLRRDLGALIEELAGHGLIAVASRE